MTSTSENILRFKILNIDDDKIYFGLVREMKNQKGDIMYEKTCTNCKINDNKNNI